MTIANVLVVARFLRKTGRAPQAIELCKECSFVLLNNAARCKEDQFTQMHCVIYSVMFAASYDMHDYTNAERYARKLLVMTRDSGDTIGEGKVGLALATLYQKQNRFVEAKEFYERVIDIMKTNGDRLGEAAANGNLGSVFSSLGEQRKAKEYVEKALLIMKEIDDKEGEALCYSALGAVFIELGKYKKASEYFNKAQRIRKEIGGRKAEADDSQNQAALFLSLGDCRKAKEYLEESLSINVETGDREKEVNICNRLGCVFLKLSEHNKAEEYFERARLLTRDIGDNLDQLLSLLGLTFLKLVQSKLQEMNSYLLPCIEIFENLRNLITDNDQLKILHLEKYSPYELLSALLVITRNYKYALYVNELGRARALADLMEAQYSVRKHISADPQSWSGIETEIMDKKCNCICLYISSFDIEMHAMVLKSSGDIYFYKNKVEEDTLRAELVVDLDGLFNKSFRSYGILPKEICEDRSLDDTAVPKSLHDDSRAPFRGNETKDCERRLHLFYKLIIAPMVELLTEPEIIIVPDRSLYRVPFAALRDESGEKYLSENFRIRIVPSLTTLKLIQDSPADYHSHTGALIVGDPEVGKVLYKGKPKNITPLPCARKEAEKIGRLLGVQPLLGERATKMEVLHVINSVSVIHFVAHGNAERGEIALSPNRTSDSLPQEENYLLTMADISQVQLRAKLVVLSCCHSGRGQIGAEGVIGIARAFLGSGARSVLVALWALNDAATEQLMTRFYEHLVGGESASESLHEAMKWMRSNGFTKVSEWAPFMLIGDNVTIDFRNKGKEP